MTKELFVSSTPHEIKVGMVEDDQLAEVYLERENEYTLAGSIYKGRVTRVLPGMQSAFVDIGLERDAFLYVSDFMELENQDDELDDVAIPVQEYKAAEQSPESASAESAADTGSSREARVESRSKASSEQREGRGGWRGRRRRRGQRDGANGPEQRHSRASESAPRPEREQSRETYGPPAGYEPIILPGESISKYSRRAQPVQMTKESAEQIGTTPDIAAVFPEDEPIFAQPGHETEETQDFPPAIEDAAPQHPEHAIEEQSARDFGSEEWEREQKRLHQMNVAEVFGGEETEVEEDGERQPSKRETFHFAADPSQSASVQASAAGTLEHEEIDEEEADLASYVEELEEDAAFDEMEEETTAASDFAEPAAREITASAEGGQNAVPFSAEPVSEESAQVAESEEVDDVAEEEAELEEAQAEAEALLAAEGIEGGTVDARAEVRAPAATSAYTQRAPRPGSDRDRDRRGGARRFVRGRRFRRQQPQNLPQITDLLKEGQEILVQIAKEPIGKKGARITSHIALPGRFLVYMPTVNHTGVSRKIASEEERQRLKRIIMSERENGHGGFIVRTAAQGADEQELRADIRFLKGLWTEIRTRAENSKPPALIYHDLNVVERVLRDQVTSDFSAIWVDTEQEYERILRFANRFQPALIRRVKLYSKETPLFEQFGLNEEINKALKSKVWLKSGGYIVINQTEALVAIDVNTGKYVGKTARLEDTIVKTNVDAVKEMVRQIRLRELAGIIVVDFIDMY